MKDLRDLEDLTMHDVQPTARRVPRGTDSMRHAQLHRSYPYSGTHGDQGRGKWEARQRGTLLHAGYHSKIGTGAL